MTWRLLHPKSRATNRVRGSIPRQGTNLASGIWNRHPGVWPSSLKPEASGPKPGWVGGIPNS
jgi:hypothetical protein